MKSEAGKGPDRRPRQTGDEEHRLRLMYADGELTLRQYRIRYNRLLRLGKITRSGRAIR
jgi:hypothetical protein